MVTRASQPDPSFFFLLTYLEKILRLPKKMSQYLPKRVEIMAKRNEY